MTANLQALVGKRVLVRTSLGEQAGTARYTRIGGDEQWLVVDLDSRPGIGTSVHPDDVLGPEPGHASLWDVGHDATTTSGTGT